VGVAPEERRDERDAQTGMRADHSADTEGTNACVRRRANRV
jgi:hypothetical protein